MIEHWLGNTSAGVVKSVRPAQLRLAKIIEETLRDGGLAMVEAATGTGKSLGALVPAIESGKRIIISTAKKALQRQMRDVDLPRLHQVMPNFSSATLKGKSNYACQLRVADFLQRGALGGAQREAEDFAKWLNDGQHTGEFSDYPVDISFEPQARVTECISRQCRFASNCGYRKAKALAEKANIIVVNHALLAYDLALGSGGKVLGPYDCLIIDEAHQAAQYFREALTCRLSKFQIDQLERLLSDTAIDLPPELQAAARNFLGSLPEKGIVPKNDVIVGHALRVQRHLLVLKEQFIHDGVWSQTTESNVDSTKSANEVNKLRAAAVLTQRLLRACEVCVDKLDTTFDSDNNEVITPDSYVPYVESGQHRQFVVAPIEVGPFVAGALKKLHACVFMSATLSTGGNFNYMCRELGLKPEDVTHKEVLPHAFNYRQNSCLYISGSIPEFKRDTAADFWRLALQEMEDLLTASQGGALILCASNADVNTVYDDLSRLTDRTYTIRKQEDNVDTLIEWFKADPKAVAVGTKSLWEGIDIPGLGLRLVIIPRLPFPTPEDPVLLSKKRKYVARSVDRGNAQNVAELSAWRLYDLQTATIDLKQGAGRLIRRESDKGVVAILDRRMYGQTKGYSADLRKALPHPVTNDIEATKRLLTVLASIACSKKT